MNLLNLNKDYVLITIFQNDLGSLVSFIPFIRLLKKKYNNLVIITNRENKELYKDHGLVLIQDVFVDELKLAANIKPIKYYRLSPKSLPKLFLNNTVLNPSYTYNIKNSSPTGFEKELKTRKRLNQGLLEDLFKSEGTTLAKHLNLFNAEENDTRYNWVILCLSSSTRSKDLSFEMYIRIIGCLQKFGPKIILVGNKKEDSILAKGLCSIDKRVRDFTCKTNLSQLAELIKRSKLVIGPDTGTMHLAEYYSTKTLTIYRHTNSLAFGHFLEGSIDLQLGDAKEINIGAIQDAIHAILRSK